MEKIIKFIAYIVFCLFWIPIGLFVWISMLLRITMVFVAISIAAAISNRGTAPSFEDKFESASMFFVQGFKSSYEALFHNKQAKYQHLSWRDFFAQLLLTIFFYGILYLFVELKNLGIAETWRRIQHLGS